MLGQGEGGIVGMGLCESESRVRGIVYRTEIPPGGCSCQRLEILCFNELGINELDLIRER